MSSSNPEALQKLRDAFAAAKVPYFQDRLREALDLLEPALHAFAATEGERPALVKPLTMSAEIVHRLGDAHDAHTRLSRALAIARAHSEPASLQLADALCLAAMAERGAKCPRAISLYEQGLEDAVKVGASDKWMVYELNGLVEALLDMPGSGATFAYATKAAELALRIDGPDSLIGFIAWFNLGRAQIDAGMSVEATATFERLLEARKKRLAGQSRTIDKWTAELKTWLAKAKGAG